MIERCQSRPIAHMAEEMGISRATAFEMGQPDTSRVNKLTELPTGSIVAASLGGVSAKPLSAAVVQHVQDSAFCELLGG